MKKGIMAIAALALSVGFSAGLLPGTAWAAEGWDMTEEGWPLAPINVVWRDWYIFDLGMAI